MNNFPASYPSNSRHFQHTRRFLLVIGGIFLVAFLVAALGLINIAQRLDEQENSKTQLLIEKALQTRTDISENQILSYAIWDAAYAHLTGSVDRQWAYDEHNLGEALFTSSGFEGVFVVDRQLTRYALYKGQPSDAPLSSFITAPVEPLVDAAREQMGKRQAISRFVLFNGWPAILLAAAIQPSLDGPAVAPEDTSVMILVDQLTPAKLLRMGASYGLNGLMIKSNETLGPAEPHMALDQTGFFLTWEQPQPGSHLLWSLLPTLGVVSLVLALLIGYFFRFALRVSREMDTSYRVLSISNQALEASEERFRDVAEAASDWIWETDARGRLTYLSGRFVAVTGYASDEWLGKGLDQLLSCETTPIGPWLATLPENPGGGANLRCAYRDQAGQTRFCRVSARPILRDDAIQGFRGTASDITEEVAAHAQIQHLSLHDALTGLPNRNMLARYLESALAPRDAAPPLTLLLIDLDNFKPINDSLGHPAGDAVLMEIAHRLKQTTRDLDLVARLGGDEFVLILCGPENRLELDRFCTRLIERLQRPIEHAGQSLQVGASLGIAQSRHQGYDGPELIRCADIALYQAKAAGKNTWRYFSEQMSEQIQHRRQLESELRLAIRNQEFVLHFQPRYRVADLEIVSVEALVRWNHPIEGLLAPDTFIPLAEQTDLIVPLGRWVLREACETARRWPSSLLVSVNLSPAQFARSDVVADIREVLIQTGFPAQRLELEITEGVMLNDVDNALNILTALKELGVRLNMDDFGTGYSSLGYLRTYPFDSLKIDKRFISSLTATGNERAVVQAIINLGNAMGMTVTAEGVETEQQLQTLASDACHEVQGFYLSRPMDKQALEILLEQHQVAIANRAAVPRRSAAVR